MEHIKKYWHILVGCLCVVVLGAVYLIRDNSPAAQPNHERLLVASGENTQIAQTEPSEPLQSQQSEPIAETVENPVEIPVETLAETPIEQVPQNIVVHITGEVTNPGVYTIPADFRINDLLELAGGATDDADLSLINLAAFLQDAQQIVVPAYGDEFFTPEIPQTSQTAAVTQNTGQNTGQKPEIKKTYFNLQSDCTELSRTISTTPFVPTENLNARCEEVLNIQANALVKRLRHVKAKTTVIGISGGLDSTLALLVASKAATIGKTRVPNASTYKGSKDVLALTMPCFGTTSRTLANAHKLCKALRVPCQEIDITASVKQHLTDIGHSMEKADITFENAQARMRTLVLMNFANQNNGLVLGTGDLSELALGFATYNGDHMSMYGVNSGVPKTLIWHIIKYVADTTSNLKLAEVLTDILDTPISPELLPADQDEIVQRTEDIIGPYELHDFFLYHMLGKGRSAKNILELACFAFDGKYPKLEIKKTLQIFYKRFFSQQFKRNCSPDSPKIGSISLSPHEDWKMPSDAVPSTWIAEIL